MSKLNVNMLPLQAHCFAFGGFEIQMLELYNALRLRSELNVKKMNPWDRDLDFDILHLWGLEQANFNNAYWGKKNNKKVVITALIGQIETTKDALRFIASKYLGNVRFLMKLLENIDALVVVNEMEAEKALKYFKLPENKVFVVPNLITSNAIDSINVKRRPDVCFNNYYFCAGNISERKNQLLLAKAANETKTNIVFAGDFICSPSYKESFLNLVSKSENLSYVGNLPNTSQQLFDLFIHADGFCLPSYQETQPISVLEAAFFGKNIMIGDSGYSRQHLFRNLIKVNVSSISSIAEGIKMLEDAKDSRKYTIEKEDINKCLYHEVSKKYLEVYLS